MSLHSLELPPSAALAMAAASTLAFVLLQTPQSSAGKVRAHTNEVKTKLTRLAAEVKAWEELAREGRAVSSSGTEVADHVADGERMADYRVRARRCMDRMDQAAGMLARAIDEATPMAPMLERALPGWTAETAGVRAWLDPLRSDIAKAREHSRTLEGIVEQFLPRSFAETGLQEWATALPSEPEPLFDEDDVEPVRWDPAHGWIEGRT